MTKTLAQNCKGNYGLAEQWGVKFDDYCLWCGNTYLQHVDKVGMYYAAKSLAEGYDSKKCVTCDVNTFYVEWPENLGEGHNNTIDGKNEFVQTGMCEHCTDISNLDLSDESDALTDGDKNCEKCGAGMHFDLTYTETQSAYVCGNPECDGVIYGTGGF